MSINTFDDMFLVKKVREELIKGLKEKGYKDDKIEELIKVCDEAYKNYKMPYPTLDELLKDAE